MTRARRTSTGRPVVVLVDARYAARPGVGIHTFLLALIALLAALPDVELHLAVAEAPGPDFVTGGATVHVLRPRRSALLWEQVALPRLMRSLGARVFIAPANRGVPLLRPARRSVRVLLVVHDLIPLVLWREYARDSPLGFVKYVLETVSSVWRADQVLAVSRATATDLRRVLHRASTAASWPVAALDLPARNTDGPRTRDIVYNGGLDIRKCPEAAIEGFAHFARTRPEYRLVLLGAGYEMLDGLVAELGICSQVLRAGYVTAAERDAYVRGAAAVLYTSRYEGFGLPIVEALAAGTPVVCGSGGAQGETCGPAGLVVADMSPITLCEALATVTAAGYLDGYATSSRAQLAALRDDDSFGERIRAAVAPS